MAFVSTLRQLIDWDTTDTTDTAGTTDTTDHDVFATCRHITLRDPKHNRLDFAIDIAQIYVDSDIETAYDSFDPLNTIRYVMNTFFYDHTATDRRHILAHAYVLIDRIVKHQGMRIPLSAINSIVCTSLIISSKLLEDDHLCNGYWAKCLRFSDKILDEQYSIERRKLATNMLNDQHRKRDLQTLEIRFFELSLLCFNRHEEEFLKLCKFDLFVTASELETTELFMQNMSQTHASMTLS